MELNDLRRRVLDGEPIESIGEEGYRKVVESLRKAREADQAKTKQRATASRAKTKKQVNEEEAQKILDTLIGGDGDNGSS